MKKIRGNTVGTTTPRPDFNQSNSKKADYIKNRPLDRLLPAVSANDENKTIRVKGGKWEAVPPELITPQMFGAKADGKTDDSKAILEAIKALPTDGGTLYFPPGVYIHGDGVETGVSYDSVANENVEFFRPHVTRNLTGFVDGVEKDLTKIGRDIRFYFDGYKNLTILGYGAEIRSNGRNGQNRNNAMFMFKNCQGVTIKGLKLDGRRQERGVEQDDYIPGSINEFLQCNITFSYGSRDILIQDVTSVNSVHDAISIGWECDNVKIINCVCDNAQRNGIAICGCNNVVIDGCQCNDNGVSGNGYRGIAPKCGIDIEGHYKQYPNINVHVSNCNIENNKDLGITISNWASTVTIDGCYFKNNRTNVYDKSKEKQTENIYITNSTLINSRLHAEFTVSENNYVENHYVKGDPYLANGWSFDDSDSRADIEYICKNNIFKFIVDNESDIDSNSYMGIRLEKKMNFIGNRVIGAFSAKKDFYPAKLLNSCCKDNVFERVYTELNGINLLDYKVVNVENRIYYSEGYGRGQYRENNDFGEYKTYGRVDMNRKILTDTSITKSYSLIAEAGSVFKIKDTATTKLNAFYLGQEEEVIFPSWSFSRIQHILKHESLVTELKDKTIFSVYINSETGNGCIYVKFNFANPNFTVTRNADNAFGQAIFGDPVEDVTDKVKSGEIELRSNMGIYMIRTYGNDRKIGYGMLPGTTYFDTSLHMQLLWDGSKWIDKDGNDASRYYEFTIDGVPFAAKYQHPTNAQSETFASWVKSDKNTLRLRLADTGSDPVVVTADGNKTLYVVYDGGEVPNRASYGIMSLKNGGAYFFKDTPNANPDYSKVPVFWNGTELVSATIYNGEVE